VLFWNSSRNFKEAISHYHQVMRLKPDFNDAVYYNMACIYARQNKIEESIDWLKRAVDNGFKRWESSQD
jgi:tetratricopeptide (TPR) repeat protein